MQNILISEKLQLEAFQTALKWNWPWRNDWTSRIILHWSTSVLLETSLILFYPIYWYHLQMETKLFEFLSLNSSSWFWDLKTSRPAAKKKIRTTIFFWYFRGAVSRGTSPLDSPISVLCESDQLNKKHSKFCYSNKNKQKQKRTWFLNLLGRLKYWLINSLWKENRRLEYVLTSNILVWKKINPLFQKAIRSKKIKTMEIK